MTSAITIWVMDSDLCENCDALLDDFGLCPNGCIEVEDYDEWEEYDDGFYDLDFDEQGRYIGG